MPTTPPPSSLTYARIDGVIADLVRGGDERSPDRDAEAIAPAPVHVVYGGAHLYRGDSPSKLAKIARAAMDTWGKDDDAFAALMGVRESKDTALPAELARRVREKLARDPVEKT